MILLLGLALNATFIPSLTPPTLEALLDYTIQMEGLFVSQPGPTVKLLPALGPLTANSFSWNPVLGQQDCS